MKYATPLITIVLATLFSGLALADNLANPAIGKHLYRSYCALCHTENGNGKGPLAEKLGINPADLTANSISGKSIEEITKKISGYKRTTKNGMPTWADALPKSNIRHIAAYVIQLSEKPMAASGNVRRGRALFDSACVACHGKKGKGDGLLAGLIEIPMVDFTNKARMREVTDNELAFIIEDGRGDYMPSWKESFSDNEVRDLAAFIRSIGRK